VEQSATELTMRQQLKQQLKTFLLYCRLTVAHCTVSYVPYECCHLYFVFYVHILYLLTVAGVGTDYCLFHLTVNEKESF